MKIDKDKFTELISQSVLGALSESEKKELEGILKNADEEMIKQYRNLFLTSLHLPLTVEMHEPSHRVKESVLEKIRSMQKENIKDGKNASQFTFLMSQEGKWVKHPVEGVYVKLLSADTQRNYGVMLYDVEAGIYFPPHHHSGPEECYVLEGDLQVGERILTAGDFHHADADSDHGMLYTKNGCRLLIIAALSDYYPA